MSGTPVISVVVPALAAEGSIGRCLDAIAAQQGAPEYEVIVVDNASPDATVAIARGHPVGARVLVEPGRGSYAARNTGIRSACGRILAFTDADCVPEPGWLAAGAAALEAGAQLAGGAVVPIRSTSPTAWERFDSAVYLRQGDYVDGQGFAATANLFAVREVFDVIGVFDASLMSSGDLELCSRAVRRGAALVFVSAARVRHQPRTTRRRTWELHRRLGAGWAALARRGERPPALLDPWLWMRPSRVADAVAADGAPLPYRRLVPVIAVAVAARWTGRLTARA